MTKSAIKKYTERLGFFGMILHYIGRFMTKTEQQVIGKLTVRFGKVKKNRLVFKNREMMDCTDNPEAFYEYLISSGYNKKYEIIWLVSEKRKFRNQNTGNVKFVTAENKYGWSSPLAYYYGATAGFFFYSHNSAGLNRYRCKGQTVVNLWHGCGYKDAEQGTQEQGSPNGTQNTSPRARLEWNVLWRKCHPGTRTPFYCRPAEWRTTVILSRS